MNSEYTENLREKLRNRVEALYSMDHPAFHFSLKRFWDFVSAYPVFVDILQDLQCRCPTAEGDAGRIMAKGEPLHGVDELEQAALSYFVVRRCAESDNGDIEWNVGMVYRSSKYTSELLGQFRLLFVDPLYRCLDEQLSDQRFLLAVLRRYKHKCEWFQKKPLFDLWQADMRRGEKHLALHLYEYLHDQGVDFVIEPLSASGEVDLIAAQAGDYPLIADAKVFGPDTVKGYIAKGFSQIYQYTQDYNEPFGYLVIYNTSGKDLEFNLADQEQHTPSVTHNNKTIFLLTIDVFPYEETASQRGPLTAVTITQEDLIRVVETQGSA